MGLARIYLALCVVAAHSSALLPWGMHGGTEAVQIFFMISGFYMSMITGKYLSKREFYISRFLRIFVPYYIVLFFIVAISVCTGLLTGKWLALTTYSTWSAEQNGFTGTCFAALSNLTVICSDWTIFLADESGVGLTFCFNFHSLQNPLTRYLANPPIWSVGVEVLFYLIVPFIGRLTTRTLVSIWAALIAARLGVYECLSLDFDPWTYRFFPLELSQFVLGMISYRVYSSTSVGPYFQKSMRSEGAVKRYLLFCILAVTAFWLLNSFRSAFGTFVSVNLVRQLEYVGWACVIPALFELTKNNRFDRWIGELSYPLYLIHYFIVGLVGAFFTRFSIIPESGRGWTVAVISLALSALLLTKCIQPCEKRRMSIVNAWAAKPHPVNPSKS